MLTLPGEISSTRIMVWKLDCINVSPALWLESITGKLSSQGHEGCSLGHLHPYGSPLPDSLSSPLLEGDRPSSGTWPLLKRSSYHRLLGRVPTLR